MILKQIQRSFYIYIDGAESWLERMLSRTAAPSIDGGDFDSYSILLV
jgi:hypothetical protein